MSARPSEPRAERGQILAIFAGGLIVLLVLVGLVIDGGMAFFNRREAQNTADLASMAGTKLVADHYLQGGRTGSQVFAAVTASATVNGCLAAMNPGAAPGRPAISQRLVTNFRYRCSA